MQLAEALGSNMRRLRAERRMTLEAVAHEVGLSYSYVGQLERGQRNATLDVVERLAAVFGVPPLALLDG